MYNCQSGSMHRTLRIKNDCLVRSGHEADIRLRQWRPLEAEQRLLRPV